MNPTDFLQVPAFNRLADYCGLWAIEPTAFDSLWRMALALDMQQHVAAKPEPIRSALEKASTGRGRSVAMIRATGLLMKSASSLGGTSSIQLRRDIRQAAADPDVSAILLAFDSPGGTVAGTADLAADVRAARKSKPVWAHIDDLGASAAYWVASQAERVFANDSSALIGSIGTYQILRDFSAAAEREGVKTHVIKTGPLKGAGSPGAPVTDEQLAHVQQLVNATQEIFDAAVRKGRGLSASELEAVRHGGVLMADDAKSARLIDGIQPLGKTITELARAAESHDPRRAIDDHEDAGRAGVASVFPMLSRGVLPTRHPDEVRV